MNKQTRKDMSILSIIDVITSMTVFIAVVQLIRQIKTENAQSFFYMHQYLSQEEFSTARKFVRSTLYKIPYSAWTEEHKDYANKVCSSYDQAGILLKTGAISKKNIALFLSSSWGQSIIDQYESLTAYLDDKQTPNKTGREFFVHFTELYEKVKW
jgi:uncharacterized protein with von Willebrand factor type A (vWA) domain